MTDFEGPDMSKGPDGEIGVLAAVVGAIGDIGAIGKDGEANLGKGGRFSFRSADAVWTAVNPILATHGLLLVPSMGPSERGVTVRFHLYHLDSSYLFGEVTLAPNNSGPQAAGAALSYAAKYWLSQVLAIPFDDPATEADSDEANQAQTSVPATTARRPQAARPAQQATTGPPPTQEQVAALLARVQALPDDFKQKFRDKAAALGEGSWSFTDAHTWTAAEYLAACSASNRLRIASEASASIDTDVAAVRAGTSQPDRVGMARVTARVAAKKAKLGVSWDDILAVYNERASSSIDDETGDGPAFPLLDTEDEALADPVAMGLIDQLLGALIDDGSTP